MKLGCTLRTVHGRRRELSSQKGTAGSTAPPAVTQARARYRGPLPSPTAVETLDRPTLIETAARYRRTSVETRSVIWTRPPVVPRACADKHSVHKPVGAVVPGRRAGVRIRRIVSVGANWRSGHDGGADPDSHSHSDLRVGITQRQDQHSQQSQISKVSHGIPPCFRSAACLRQSAFSFLQNLCWIERARAKKVAARRLADFGQVG